MPNNMPETPVDGITSAEGRLVSMQLAYLRGDLAEVKGTMANMATSIASLVRIEEQQSAMRAGMERAFTEIAKGSTETEGLEKRITAVEQELPNYRGLRKWVIGGILAGLAMLGTLVFKQIILDPLQRGWTMQPPQKPAVYSTRVW